MNNPHHSKIITSPVIKKKPESMNMPPHSSNGSVKNVKNNVEFNNNNLLMQEPNLESQFLRKPSKLPKKQNNKKTKKNMSPNNTKNMSKSTDNAEISPGNTEKKTKILIKKNVSTDFQDAKSPIKDQPTLYAGGGYENTADAKMLQKPKLSTPKKINKKNCAKNLSPENLTKRFSSSANANIHHSSSDPQLLNSITSQSQLFPNQQIYSFNNYPYVPNNNNNVNNAYLPNQNVYYANYSQLPIESNFSYSPVDNTNFAYFPVNNNYNNFNNNFNHVPSTTTTSSFNVKQANEDLKNILNLN